MCCRQKHQETTFLLEEEVKYCFEGLSVNLNAHTTFKFVHDDRLPDLVKGDL